MTLEDLIDQQRHFVVALKSLEHFVVDISRISKSSKSSFDSLMVPLLRNGMSQEVINHSNSIRGQIIAECTRFSKSFDLLNNHQAIFSTKQKINDMAEEAKYLTCLECTNAAKTTIATIEAVIGTIYGYVVSPDHGQLQLMLDSIQIAVGNYNKFMAEFENIEKIGILLEREYSENERIGKKEITLHFYNSESDLNEFVAHYKSIIKIYEELCSMADIDDKSLQIIRIESGSFFEKLFGIEKIIDVMSYLLKNCIDLVFKKYTQEGRIIRRKELMDIISGEIDLVKKCQEAGIEASPKTKDRIEKSIAVIAGETLLLASRSAKVKIDDEEYSTLTTDAAKYIEHGRMHRLEMNHDINSENKT